MNISSAVSVKTVLSSDCPLNTAGAVLDQVMAAVAADGDLNGLDTALDLRLALAEEDHETTLHQYFRLHSRIGERHYLACYRLRRWIESQFCAIVVLTRVGPACEVGLRLDTAGLDALRQQCLAAAAAGSRRIPAGARVCFFRIDRRPALTLA